MFISNAILLVVVVSVATSSVLATPHALHHPFHHRAITARVASDPLPPNNATLASLRRRQTTQRCRQRPKTSSSSVHSSAPPPTSTHVQSTATTPSPVTSSKPLSSSTPKPTQPPSSGGSDLPSYLLGTQTGQGTFYASSLIPPLVFFLISNISIAGLGACGITNNDDDHIAAVSHLMFDTFPCVFFSLCLDIN